MICEKCNGDVEAVVCGHCHADLMKLGPFCYMCGRGLEKDTPGETVGAADEADELDLAHRILCSDGACIGTINEQGYCKVCGKLYVAES